MDTIRTITVGAGHRLDVVETGRRHRVRWLGLFGPVDRFYKWMTAAVMPQPGLVGAF